MTSVGTESAKTGRAAAAGEVPVDDVLDAAAAAWSAHRIASGRAQSHPEPPQRVGAGRRIALWS